MEGFNLIFNQYGKTASPPPDSEKVYAFDALHLEKGISDSWRAPYGTVTYYIE